MTRICIYLLRSSAVHSILTCFFLPLFCNNCQAQLSDQIIPISKSVSGQVAQDYIFITPSSLNNNSSHPTTLEILDSVGNPIFFKPFTDKTSAPYSSVAVSDFKLQPSGLMSYTYKLHNGNRAMYLLDSNFVIVDSIECINGASTDGHDLIHLPNGSFHLVGLKEKPMDLSSLTTKTGGTGVVNGIVIDQVIQRFDAQKNLLFEWEVLNHIPLGDTYSHFFKDSARLDHSHYNSIDIDTDGNYLLSFRHLHEITKVDSSTGQIIWRFWGKQNQFTFVGDNMPFSGQHYAKRLANGNLLLFDNGAYNSTPQARAIEYQLDETNMTATAVWQFKEPNGVSSKFAGNAHRLSNGNTL
ncbi:MAG: hypothetical protein GY810_15955 [Aureispira sp.]|nr:hypothetical protein [Aureispira sp.]